MLSKQTSQTSLVHNELEEAEDLVPPAQATRSGWQLPYGLRALHHHNFRLFFVGQFVSRIGFWMQNMAQAWLVYRLTDSEFMLGLVAFAGQLPTLLLGLFAGVVADRFSRYTVILVMLVLATLQAAVLGILTLGEWITAQQVFVLALIAGTIQTFEMPARQSFLMEIVGKEDLTSAIALNSALVNGARILGPALAGLTVAYAGEGACFSMNAVSYLAIIGAFLSMRLPIKQADTTSQASVFAFIQEGVLYAFRTPAIRFLLALIGLLSLLVAPYTVLMPVFAKDVLHGDANSMGILMGSAGMGALIGAGLLARHRSTDTLGRVIAFAFVRFGVGLVLFAWSRNFWLSLLILPLVGSGFMVPTAAINTLLQTLAPDQLRGRVMSLFFIMFMGGQPIGSLLAGYLAPLIGAPLTVGISGGCCLGVALWVSMQLDVLPHLE